MVEHSSSAMLDRLCAGSGDLRPAPSVLILAAHPDDESIGCCSMLMRLRKLVIVHVTDGAPRSLNDARAAGFIRYQDYAAARRRELCGALSLAGIGLERMLELGYADQGTSQALIQLAHEVAGLIRDIRPDAVVTHPYEGGHPDHDATSFAARIACRLLEHEGMEPPVLIEMASYHYSDGGVESGVFLPHAEYEERAVPLTDEECTVKQKMFDCYRTQAQVLRWFSIDVERFRLAPDYDFSLPPHDGVLFYETFDWGMTGSRWRQLAQEALETFSFSITRPFSLSGNAVIPELSS